MSQLLVDASPIRLLIWTLNSSAARALTGWGGLQRDRIMLTPHSSLLFVPVTFLNMEQQRSS